MAKSTKVAKKAAPIKAKAKKTPVKTAAPTKPAGKKEPALSFSARMKAAKAAKGAKVLMTQAAQSKPLDEVDKDFIAKATGIKNPVLEQVGTHEFVATPAPAPDPKPAPTPHTIQEGSLPVHTMARSYVRGGSAGRGKKRGKTYQATVQFTETQMDQVVAAAQFRQVSLSEMIRSCVVEHLNLNMG